MIKNILLVDDDEVFHLLSNKLLQRLGITRDIYTARNGKEALDFVASHDLTAEGPHVIFLDLNMPIMNGFAFIEALKSQKINHHDSLVIVIVSSSQDPTDLARAKSLGIKHYLTKPISEESIREVLTSIGVLVN
jgi:CitB family two-component system response regulator MalR